MSFIPLHVYSGYSFLKSGLKIDQYLSSAKKLGYDTVGLSDFETFTGVPRFYHECQNLGLKAVIGEDLLIDHLVYSFYVLNEQGYKNLLNLALAIKEDRASYKTVKDYQEGLAIVLSTKNEPLKSALLTNEEEFAKRLAILTKDLKNFYIGLDANDDTAYVEAIRQFASSHSYKLIAFPWIKYIKKDDAIILEMMKAIETKVVLEEKRIEGNEYFLPLEEIERTYTKEEINLISEITNNINFDFLKPRGKMISWLDEENKNPDDHIKELALQGLEKKGKTSQVYIDRLNFELDTIKKMGYSDYFLIVHDYVNYARTHEIAVGPGRGSASGSLVSYALEITVPDPLENNLLFERFLNPARQTMPDIDVDFGDIHREDVVSYLRLKYGKNRIARIIAIQTMGAKSALNDVGRIFGYDDHDIKLFTRLIKDEGDDKLTLREIYKTNAKFRDLVNDDKYYLEIVTLASKIEGMPRQSSLHAVGIVLNAEPLNDVIPLSLAFDGGYVEEFEKDYLEEQGFLKMDILPLRNLTIIEDCLTLLKDRGINLDRDAIPYNDPEAIKVIGKGKTMGLFQLESAGMRNAIRVLKIKTFEDVVALLALYRPGPMDSINDFAKKKNSGLKPAYLSPALEEILAPTYGTIVYQEQIMQIASKMAGFTLGEADSFRRAVSKKDSKKLESLRKSFVDGAIKKGYKEKEATDVFNLIDKFANYGFNRSHSVVYSIFTCRMAYLKANYPAEFYASILSNSSSDQFNNTLSEMKASGIKARCPDINESTTRFRLIDNTVLFPLSSVKGISGVTATNIIEERKAGNYKDFFDFVVRMSKYRFNDAQLMNLIDAGAFDCFEKSRATVRMNVPNALSYADALVNDQGLLVMDPSFLPPPTFIRTEDNYLDNLNREFNALGLMISGSPLDIHVEFAKKIGAIKLDQIENSNGAVKTMGIIKTCKKIMTKKQKPMAFVTVYDDTCEKEFTVFTDAFERSQSYLGVGKIVVIEGYYRSFKDEFSVNSVVSVEEYNHE